ncbi:MAG: hypothetical protein BMS9Abin07_1026 [Acidimicrobiia bacterium]|nr:MAG: hypothetical protein BMS9Abin07_1026 [Acidimicrobiia bacterium]
MPHLAVLGPIFAQAEGGSSAFTFLLPLAILGVLFYVMVMLPRRRQAKKAQELLTAITVGDDVRTIGGIFGRVRSEDDDTYTIDIGGGNTMRIAKRAIAARIGEDQE